MHLKGDQVCKIGCIFKGLLKIPSLVSMRQKRSSGVSASTTFPETFPGLLQWTMDSDFWNDSYCKYSGVKTDNGSEIEREGGEGKGRISSKLMV